MNRKLTLFDFALWAALPMAHTSKIEGRLTMILDSTRRRTLPRRALMLGVALGAAALVPLAVLRPVAKAQVVPAVTDIVQIVGVADVTAPSAREWDRNGNMLQVPAFHPPAFQRSMSERISAPLGQKALCLAFRIPMPLQQSARIIVNDSDAPLGSLVVTSTDAQGHSLTTAGGVSIELFGSPYTYTAGFPAALTSANFQVGVASDAGTETVNCPKTAGKVRQSRPLGDVLFTLIPDPHGSTSVQTEYGSRGQTPPKSAAGDAVLMVSDHLHSPSPLPVDKTAVIISSYASRTRSSEAVQRLLHDGENYERAVYGLDKSGRIIAKLTSTYGPSLEEDDHFKMEQLISIPKPLLKRIALFRLVARPYQWTEFKDVALQPVK